MAERGFIGFPAGDLWRRPVLWAVRGAELAYAAICAAFVWQWRQHRRRYERALAAAMDARERADAGLARRESFDRTLKQYWSED